MTKNARILAMAALLATGAAAPAAAAWMPVAAVPLGGHTSVDIVAAGNELPRRVDAIALRSDTDVMCRNVEGFFRSGETMKLFSGFLPAGQENVIQMLPVHRDIARVQFDCHAVNGSTGGINLAANVPAPVVVGELETPVIAP